MKKLIHIPTLRTYRSYEGFINVNAISYANECLDDPHFIYIYCFDYKGVEWFSFVSKHVANDFYKKSYLKKRKEEFMWIEEEEEEDGIKS